MSFTVEDSSPKFLESESIVHFARRRFCSTNLARDVLFDGIVRFQRPCILVRQYCPLETDYFLSHLRCDANGIGKFSIVVIVVAAACHHRCSCWIFPWTCWRWHIQTRTLRRNNDSHYQLLESNGLDKRNGQICGRDDKMDTRRTRGWMSLCWDGIIHFCLASLRCQQEK